MIALPEGTRVSEGLIGSIMTAVYYPYRKSPDVYLVWNDEPFLTCLQCGTGVYQGEYSVLGHIRRHDRRKRVQRLAD